ncbi:MAG: M4 family metallopeptidase [Bacteroidia bacterium]
MNKKLNISHGLVRKICPAVMTVMLCLLSFYARSQQSKSTQQQLEAIAKPASTIEWIDIRNEINITHEEFLSNNISLLNLTAGSEMRYVRSESDEIGFTHYRYQQYLNGVKVLGGEMIIHEQEGRITSVNGKYLQQIPLNTVATVSEAAALQTSLDNVTSKNYLWLNAGAEAVLKEDRNDNNASYKPKGELVYAKIRGRADKAFTLCWKYDIYVEQGTESQTIFVDAATGKIINTIPLAKDCSSGSSTTLWNGARTIYTQLSGSSYRMIDDCQTTLVHTRNGNGTNSGAYIEYTDANNAWSTSANQEYQAQIHYGARQLQLYYNAVHSRTSYNGGTATYRAYGNPGFTGNAYWLDGPEGAFFGGSSTGTSPYITLDVAGHELTHGVVLKTAGLVYQDESGALNESTADCFGEMSESYALGTPDWIHRAEIGGGNRSFINPNSKGQPDTYLGTNWYSGTSDNGGVHTNSGVQNFWFYLLSEGGSGTNDNGLAYNITGIGRFAARDILYRALTMYENSATEYIDARAATLHAAVDLYGSCSTELEAVGFAWRAVGVESQSAQYINNACGNYPATATFAQAIHQLTAANGCTTNITASATTVYFSAVDRVILYPGFRAISGSKFYAYLEPCAISRYKGASGPPPPVMSDAEKGIIKYEESSSSTGLSLDDAITAGPNPVTDELNLTVILPTESQVKIQLFDALGNVIENWDEFESLSHGLHNLTYSTSRISPGMYFVNVSINGQNHMKKIVKV